MRVAVVVGVAVEHDAISSAALEQVSALQVLPGVDEVHLFTQWLDREPRCASHVIANPWELLRHPAFRSCDVAIFHWGIHYALFDALTLLGRPELPTPVVHFHNCTPPSLVDEGDREQILRSIQQLHHVIAHGTPMWTYSEFNRRTLIDWGASDAQVDWVTFPVVTASVPSRSTHDDVVRLLSVGRLVPAKGVNVLLDALTLLPPAVLERTRLRIVSSATFSSDGYRDVLDEQIAAGPPLLADAVEFLTAPSDVELAALYQESDIVVSTSFHEGLCVPVIEGYAAGCRAIGTTAGNLPYIVFAPDPVVPPGDPAALAAALELVLADLTVADAGYHERCRELVDSFTPRRAVEMLERAMADVLGQRAV